MLNRGAGSVAILQHFWVVETSNKKFPDKMNRRQVVSRQTWRSFQERLPVPDVSPQAFHNYLVSVKSAGTARKYAGWARHFIETAKESGYDNFDEMPRSMIADYVGMLYRDGKAPATLHNALYGVKKYLRWVNGLGVETPVFAPVDLPKIPQVVKEVLTPNDLSYYFELCHKLLEEPVRSAALLLPCSGLRVHEMAILTLHDIKRERIRFKNGTVKETFVLTPIGKGNKQRIVPLLNEGVEILTGYLAGYRRKQKGIYVFPSTVKKYKGGRPLDARSIRGGVQKVRESMGMDFTPHTMRRTYLTILWRKGVDVATIAKIAGHAGVQTLIHHYLSLDSQDITSAVHERGASLED